MNLLWSTSSFLSPDQLPSLDRLTPLSWLDGTLLAQAPYGLSRISGAFPRGPAALYVALALLILLILAVVGMWWYNRKHRQSEAVKIVNDPDKLFTDLLAQIDLTEPDKQLLRRMTAAARLRHPATALLSPDLLEWTRQLWLKEQGPKTPTSAQTNQLKNIAVKIYDHPPTSPNQTPTTLSPL